MGERIIAPRKRSGLGGSPSCSAVYATASFSQSAVESSSCIPCFSGIAVTREP